MLVGDRFGSLFWAIDSALGFWSAAIVWRIFVIPNGRGVFFFLMRIVWFRSLEYLWLEERRKRECFVGVAEVEGTLGELDLR